MSDVLFTLLTFLTGFFLLCITFLVYVAWIGPRSNPLRKLPGPPSSAFLDSTHMTMTVE